MKFCISVVAFLMSFDTASAALEYELQQTDDGGKFIVISGKFELSDNLSRLQSMIAQEQPLAVTFNSSGGNVVKAIELGRLIRASGLHTIQIRGSECASACALAFMGGNRRFAQPGSIGVHKSSFDGSAGIGVDDAVSAVQQLTAEQIGYMSEMGVDPQLLQLALQYDSDDIRYLSASEMERFRVTNSSRAPDVIETANEPKAIGPSLSIPAARTGIVKHPKSKATLKAAPDPDAGTLANMPNDTQVDIIEVSGEWFGVRSAFGAGYMHNTWIRVSEYEENSGDMRFVQIRSVDNFTEAEGFAQASRLPLDVHLASNTWFAITLRGQFSEREAKDLSAKLKAEGMIPDDSMVTLGNTYVRKVCCE